mmetsp:Transcript_95470/g.275048  ORF Transcript_95470/g.275048 Transcript_95470/m.275048 type:complete len:186 (+) Transcript_95470:118-675(+)|eukprot:CAMPEP_0170298430 /NCGR_PEP_ID=MMETSP0116_2-20130129/49394_1 /TAXON_ID=400756 /ORGANISM="Durinskia baltica, Strain CSIRO CS-38" /LENGTH=185 /DNA_ID=CAMNT_0010550091 /DNA_START=113 /DNA_END=670 /DNA_ORIENTATION=+
MSSILSRALVLLALPTSLLAHGAADMDCPLPSCVSGDEMEDAGLSMLQRRAVATAAAQILDEAAVDAVRAAKMERFLAELHAQGQCDDGPGDRRAASCAVENCKRCLGSGAVLMYDPKNGDEGFTSCKYQLPIKGAPSTYCGEGFGDNTKKAGKVEDCQCCRGETAVLDYDSSAADGIGYTYCKP